MERNRQQTVLSLMGHPAQDGAATRTLVPEAFAQSTDMLSGLLSHHLPLWILRLPSFLLFTLLLLGGQAPRSPSLFASSRLARIHHPDEFFLTESSLRWRPVFRCSLGSPLSISPVEAGGLIPHFLIDKSLLLQVPLRTSVLATTVGLRDDLDIVIHVLSSLC